MSLLGTALAQIQLPPDYGAATREAEYLARKQARAAGKRINTRPADVRREDGARNRAKLVRTLLLKPGLRESEIIRASGLSRVTVRHHLDALISDGKVKTVVKDGWTRYHLQEAAP